MKNHSDQSAPKKPKNPLWVRILWFLWCTIDLKETHPKFTHFITYLKNKEIPESKIFFQNKLIKPLSGESANICKGKATKEECINSLNEIKNDKSPGSDGLTSEFYKRFWEEIGDDVLQSINSAFDKGELSICQLKGPWEPAHSSNGQYQCACHC